MQVQADIPSSPPMAIPKSVPSEAVGKLGGQSEVDLDSQQECAICILGMIKALIHQ